MLLIFVIFLIKCNILYILVSKEGGLSRIRPPPFVRHCSEYTSLRRRDRMILELCIFGNCSVGRHELKLDMDRAMQAYLKQFNSMYYRFNSLGNNLKFFLHKTFTSFYATELWYDDPMNRNRFRKIEICYHKCIKKLAGLNVWDSNHLACSRCPRF